MATHISSSVVKALGKLVGDTPYYVTMAEVLQQESFIILGRQKFYKVDVTLRNSEKEDEGRLFYWQVKKV